MERSRPLLLLGIMSAAGLTALATVGTSAPAPAATATGKTPSGPTRQLAEEMHPDRDAAAQSDAEPPGTSPKPGKGQKVLRLEDIKDLPLLHRYDLPLEKGEALLSDVKDETFGYDESAFWWLVHVVVNMPAEAFEPRKATTGYAQLLAMPSSFRGKPVTIRGAYMTCAPFETPVLAIRKEVPTLYECNIRELPLEQERPVATVIVTENPMDYLHTWDVVKVRGYFYKVRRYKGSKGEGLAPMLVAQRLVPEGRATQPSDTQAAGGAEQVMLAFMVGGILLLGIVYVFLRYKTKATPHAARESEGHRFRLRRPDRDGTSENGGPGGEGGQPNA